VTWCLVIALAAYIQGYFFFGDDRFGAPLLAILIFLGGFFVLSVVGCLSYYFKQPTKERLCLETSAKCVCFILPFLVLLYYLLNACNNFPPLSEGGVQCEPEVSSILMLVVSFVLYMVSGFLLGRLRQDNVFPAGSGGDDDDGDVTLPMYETGNEVSTHIET